MKKYTNKILLCIGVIILIINLVAVSCTIHNALVEDENESSMEYYDEYEYDDGLWEEEQF